MAEGVKHELARGFVLWHSILRVSSTFCHAMGPYICGVSTAMGAAKTAVCTLRNRACAMGLQMEGICARAGVLHCSDHM